jgi:uroporphyrinogen-III synthase
VKLNEKPEIILFFSPSAVRSFFSVNDISSETAMIAMGTTTAAAVKQYTEHPVIISPETDKTFVVNMALDYAASHPII